MSPVVSWYLCESLGEVNDTVHERASRCHTSRCHKNLIDSGFKVYLSQEEIDNVKTFGEFSWHGDSAAVIAGCHTTKFSFLLYVDPLNVGNRGKFLDENTTWGIFNERQLWEGGQPRRLLCVRCTAGSFLSNPVRSQVELRHKCWRTFPDYVSYYFVWNNHSCCFRIRRVFFQDMINESLVVKAFWNELLNRDTVQVISVGSGIGYVSPGRREERSSTNPW